ncbi:uncharacterized protein STEHIDRAFT_152138 [Stereum hirsutum FP-91666 SS1]|uniref:uncharacterized protein n=1 Tax=Stereum hirsutum (strain FP-91666) TaxID=721885 RepID=UPI000440E02C|nr:uncharacterized protein STEHIDRAFT_152138 [Stereum hirsutum FP-91666 SS1]EIM92834.1 hypothetical protein STEHIDRAFT_152138 [Stereum hirsutum FP-91666 SS1]
MSSVTQCTASGRPRAQTMASDLTSCQKTINGGMNAALLECGLISHSFGKEAARRVFETILNKPFNSLHVCYEGSRRCFFLPPNALGYPHMPICLDFYHDLCRSVIPQRYWQPVTDSNCGRYVVGAKLEKPIFLDHLDGRGLGLTVAQACEGTGTHIRGWYEVAELGGKATTQVRLWLHDEPWQRQIGIRDQTQEKNPITLRHFVRHLGTSMKDYLKNHPLYSKTGQLIAADDLLILGTVHISAGSWQLILASPSLSSAGY